MRTNTGQILYIPKIGQRADFQHPLMKGCLGWWPLTDGAGGILKDISGNGLDATLNGSSTWEMKTLGTVNRFDNDTTRGNNASTANVQLDLSTYTACFWVRHEELYSGTNNYGGAICLTYGPSLISDLEIYTNSFAGTSQYHQIVHNRNNGGIIQAHSFNGAASEQQADNNNWVFWAITYDGTNVRQYKNGSLRDTSPTLAAPISTTGKKIALNQVEDFRGLTCSMQNVRLYDRPLLSSEVFELYINPWSGLSIPSATRYFFLSSPSPTINPFSRIITSSTILNKSGKTVIRRGS